MSDVNEFFRQQLVGEIKKYSPDFTDVVPSAASIASASTAYTQVLNGSASGSAATTISSPVVTFTTPALATWGLYHFDVSATLSDGQDLKARYVIQVDA